MQQTRVNEVQDNTRLGGKVNLLGIMQEIEIWPYIKMVFAQTRIRPKEWDALGDFEI